MIVAASGACAVRRACFARHAAWRWRRRAASSPAAAEPPAPGPRGRGAATGLRGLLSDGSPLPVALRAAAAARIFAEGNGFLTGQIVDRSA